MAQDTTVYYVVVHSPGEAWVENLDFREQPGVMDHVTHYARFLEQGKLLMGGPFLAPHSGGLMIAQPQVPEEELRAYAAADPAVQSKLLTFEIRSWYVPMSR